MILKDSIKINKPAKAVFGWFKGFVRNYKSWHPEHVAAKWLKGKDFSPGSVLYAEEYLNGRLEKLRFKITNYVPNKLIEYKLLFPESLICSGGSFSIDGHGRKSVFTATLSFRFFSKFFRVRMKAVKKHMKEEGKNLKKILE